MSVLKIRNDGAKRAANGKVLVWNPKKKDGGGWQWLASLKSGPSVWSDLTAWGFGKKVNASSSAADKKAHKEFLVKLQKRARAIAATSRAGASPAASDNDEGILPQPGDPTFNTTEPDMFARSIRMVPAGDLTTTTLPDYGLWFPIAPESYEISQTYDWEQVDIIGLGRTAHAGIKGLPELTIEAYLPYAYDANICLGINSDRMFEPPHKWIDYATQLAENMDVFRLIIGNRRSYEGLTEHSFNHLMRITEISWGEVAGMPLDRKIRVTFSGYRRQKVEYGGREWAGDGKKPSAKKRPKVFAMREGFDYQDIAKKFYGNVKYWKQIATHNKDAAAKNVRSWTNKTSKKPHEVSYTIKRVKLPNIRTR